MNYNSFVEAVRSLAKKYAQENPEEFLEVYTTDEGFNVVHGNRSALRTNWVEAMLIELAESDYDSNVILCDARRKVMVIEFLDFWKESDGYGVAKCSANDEFDERVGKAVAWAHFQEYEIPNYV